MFCPCIVVIVITTDFYMNKNIFGTLSDPMTILAEEAAKRPCLSFFQTGKNAVT